MRVNNALEQHIAVFGESGSGKTVLLSSFYGPTQEPAFTDEHGFKVTAEHADQRARLLQNYFGMKKSGVVPQTDRFESKPYSFRVEPKEYGDGAKAVGSAPKSLRLVWHDYPGQWFEQEPSGTKEAQDRVSTFRLLLQADVAVLLVDGQRLLDNVGEEDRYLNALFSNFRAGFEELKPQILVDGKPLLEFPRIWIVALSKADLLPGVDVFDFEALVMEKAGSALQHLMDTLRSMVEAPTAMSVGEDFALLSSAKFSVERIDLTQRVGLDLILPIAAVLPLEQHALWMERGLLPKKIAANVMKRSGAVVAVLVLASVKWLAKLKSLPKPVATVAALLASVITKEAVEGVAAKAGEKLEQIHDEARRNHQYLSALLTRFRIDLAKGETERILRRSGK